MGEKEINKEAIKTKLLSVLVRHVGRTNAIGMGELFEAVFNKRWNNKVNDTRLIRSLITELRREGLPICSTMDSDGGGYYIAAAGSELNDYLRRMERRALLILERNARIKRVSLPEYLGQMRLHLEGGSDVPDRAA